MIQAADSRYVDCDVTVPVTCSYDVQVFSSARYHSKLRIESSYTHDSMIDNGSISQCNITLQEVWQQFMLLNIALTQLVHTI
jgi:hypothetical protein